MSREFSEKKKTSPNTEMNCLEDGIPGLGYMVRITPIYKPWSERPFGRGPTTRSLGDFLTMVINHLHPSWDDPPSGLHIKKQKPPSCGEGVEVDVS